MSSATAPGRGLAWPRLLLGVLVALALVVALLVIDPLDLRGRRELTQALVERGRVAVIGDTDWLQLKPQAATLIDARAVPGLGAALAGNEVARLTAILARAGIQHLLIAPAPAGDHGAKALAARLARYEPITGLRGLYVSPKAALYAVDPFEGLPQAERDALAVVARRMLAGARSPRLQSFPELLRRVQPVEVMVLLREHGKPRLWRSARGSSLARALLTAVEVARERWHEREQAMGGLLGPMLPTLEVEIALLIDDGTVASSNEAFVDRVFFPAHGVGYERKGAWRYLLPDATAEAGHGRATRAYHKLFADDGLSEDSLSHPDVRLYRLRVETLAVSAPAPIADDGLDPPRTPDEVLAPRKSGAQGEKAASP